MNKVILDATDEAFAHGQMSSSRVPDCNNIRLFIKKKQSNDSPTI